MKKNHRYKQQLSDIRYQMQPRHRFVSHLLHQPLIEWLAEKSALVFSPHSLVLGGAFSLIGGIVLHSVARENGFAPAGSELLGLFVVGFVIGRVYDLLVRD